MGKKLIRISSMLSMVIGLCIYLCLFIEFKKDANILMIIANFDLKSKLYNICLYGLPCVHFVVGLLSLVFVDDKRMMKYVGIIGFCLSLIHVFFLKGNLQVYRCFLSLSVSTLFLVGVYYLYKEK